MYFARLARKHQFWVAIIEKALAKLFGSYDNLAQVGGTLSEALNIFTGCPSYEIDITEANLGNLCDDLFIMREKLKYVLSATVKSNSSNERVVCPEFNTVADSSHKILKIFHYDENRTIFCIRKLTSKWKVIFL